MTLTSTGIISLAGTVTGKSIEVETSGTNSSGTAPISLNDPLVRGFAGIASGAISMSNFYNLSSSWLLTETGSGANNEFFPSCTDLSGNIYHIANGVYLFKFSSSGTLVWAKQLSTGGITSLQFGADGYLYVTATYKVSTIIGQAILKLDTSGNIIWQSYVVPGSGSFGAVGVRTDTAGNAYTLISYSISTSSYHVITKHNSSGVLQWQRLYSNGGTVNIPTGIFLSADGTTLTITGYTNGAGGGSTNPIILSLTVSGASPSINYQKAISSSGSNYSYQSIGDSSGNIYILVYTSGTTLLNIFKISSSGTITWQYSFSSGFFTNIALDISGNLYLLGTGVALKMTNSPSVIWYRSISFSTNGSSVNNSVVNNFAVDTALTFGITLQNIYGTISGIITSDVTQAILRVPLDGSKTGSYSPANTTALITYSSTTAPTLNATAYSLATPSNTLTTTVYSSGTSTLSFITYSDTVNKTNL